MKKGILIVVSGPAGSGKGTVVEIVRNRNPEIGYSVSATTRNPREGEVDGVNYHFITKEAFEEKIEKGEVLEHTFYCGNYYGTLKEEADRALNAGRDLILEIEVEGATNIKKLYPEDAVLVMLLPPSGKVLEARLRGRKTETEDVIAERMKRAREELELMDTYDYVIINEEGQQEKSADILCGILTASHSDSRRMKYIKDGFFK